MGKRKKATKPPPKKKRTKLNKHFDCPFCGHEGTVDCYLERDEKVGRVECRVCGAKFRAIINHLDEEIDLYHKWIDACEEASKEDHGVASAIPSSTGGGGGGIRGGSPKNIGRRTSSGRDGRDGSSSDVGNTSSKRERTSIDFVVHDDDDFDDEGDDDLR